MATLNDFNQSSTGITDADRLGAVFNEPDPFVIPSSKKTVPSVDQFAAENFVPPGSLNPYPSYDPEGAPPSNTLYTSTSGEDYYDPENSLAVAINTGLSPVKVNSNSLSDVPSENIFNVNGYPLAQEPLSNPLHDYENYTYNISLHAITVEQFNNLTESPSGYIPQNVLIAGAGKYSENFKRNVNFLEDFYFDDLKINTIVNTTSRSKFSNVIDLKFKIIEPNGFTLIQRLITACESPVSQGGVGGQNYLKQPFILQIDFYGSRDGEIGAGLIPNQTKLIPIRLIGMQTRIGTQGTEYTVQATPYNHTAFDPRYIVTPAAFTMKAATVADIFQNSNVDQGVVDAETQRYRTEQEEIERLQTYANLADAFGPGTQSQEVPKATTVLGQYGLAAGYNSWYRTLARKSLNGNTYKPNTIKFVLDEELANSALYVAGPNDVSNAASKDDSKTSTQQAGGANKGQIQFNAGTITMPAGTSIQSIVKWALINSDYMRNQLLGVSSGTSKSTRDTQLKEPLKNLKIIPVVKILDYDSSRQDYQYEITYIIRKYLMNSRSPYAPQGRVKGWVKEYNWIYTGGRSPYTGENLSNNDVIDLQLDFNMLFYTALTAFKDSGKLFNSGKNLGETNPGFPIESSGFAGDPNNPAPTVPSQESPPDNQAQDRIARASSHYWSGNQDNKRTGAQQTSIHTASDIINNTQLDARGDMINVKLHIIGDPHFIKQDDMFYNINVANKTSLLTPNNSLFMDDGELYVYINFKSPVDYDEQTGLAIPSLNPYSYNEFTGVYKVISIENSFTRGRFTQTLDLVRLSIDDSKRVQAVQQSFRQVNFQEVGAGQTGRFSAAENLGQRISSQIFSGSLLSGGVGLVDSLTSQLVSQSLENIQSEVSRAAQNIGSTAVTAINNLVDDFGQDLGLVENVNDIVDFEIGDPTIVAGIPEVEWTDYSDVIGW